MSDAEKRLRELLDAALTHELLENADNAFLDSGGTGYRNAEGYDAARRVLADGLVQALLPSLPSEEEGPPKPKACAYCHGDPCVCATPPSEDMKILRAVVMPEAAPGPTPPRDEPTKDADGD